MIPLNKPEAAMSEEEHTESKFRSFVQALNASHQNIRVTRTEQIMDGQIEIKITATLKKRYRK